MGTVVRLLAVTGALVALAACTPEPPDKAQPPEPQAASEPAEAVGH